MSKLTTIGGVDRTFKKMKELKVKGDFKEAALLGMQVIDAFGHYPMIETSAYKCCFEQITKEEFFAEVISRAEWCIDEYVKNNMGK